MAGERTKRYLRSPFSDAQAVLARIAAEAGFKDGEPGSPLSFKQILGGGQIVAEQRAAMPPRSKLFLESLSLGSFPTEILSYLGTIPPEDLLPTMRARAEQLRGFIKSGEISAELDYSRPDYSKLQRSQWDLQELIERFGRRLDGRDVPSEAILDHFESWAMVIASVVVEFMPRPPAAVPPVGGAAN